MAVREAADRSKAAAPRALGVAEETGPSRPPVAPFMRPFPVCLALNWAVLAGMTIGCGTDAPASEKPVVAVTVLPQAHFVEKIAGDLVEVAVMIPPGANEHTHEPTIEQIKAVSRSSVYVKVGHPRYAFERAWLEPLLSRRQGIRIVDGSSGVALLDDDPHVWVSPSCVRAMARNIHDALVEVLPDQRAVLDANLAAFVDEIDAVDREISEILAPHRGRTFLVFHPAWGYFAREYGLQQMPIEEGEKEPSVGRLAELIEQARALGVRAIFIQPQFSRRSAELIAEEIGGRVVALDPLRRDWADGLRSAARAFAEALAS